MRQELTYFQIGTALGGSQSWFRDPAMRLGGCAAVCACDSSLYFQRFRGVEGLFPGDAAALTRQDYVDFAGQMKPYLRPRRTGIDRLSIYIDGFSRFLADRGAGSIAMEGLEGTRPEAEAEAAVAAQIGRGLPVPCLVLYHRNPALRDYVWHWFMLAGFETGPEFRVRAVTYGQDRWLSLPALWDTGYDRRGGLILYGNV
jgi:hypothetical protein